MRSKPAFLFDLNGTMVDDMRFHLDVWYQIIVHQLGAELTLEEVKREMYGKSEELLIRIFGSGRFSDDELKNLCFRKELLYRMQYRPHVDLLPGLFRFLEKAYEDDIPMAIGTASIQANVDLIINTLKISHYFGTVVCADDVIESKPHPETFLKAAAKLGIDPLSCIVFEDAPKGVEAALRAGMKSVVLTTMHQQEEFLQYPNVLLFVSDYTNLEPSKLAELVIYR